MKNAHDEVLKRLKEIAEYLGLKDFNAYIQSPHTSDPYDLQIGLQTVIKVPLHSLRDQPQIELLAQAFEPLRENIENSRLVTEYKNQIKTLEAKVEELTPYKTHYDLDYEKLQGRKR